MNRQYPQVSLARFATADLDRYAAYQQLRREVFFGEQHWRDLADEDQFDQGARLWIATAPDAATVGIVRGLRVVHGFPHRELFDGYHEVLEPDVCRVLATINALAVARRHRGLIHRVTGTPHHGTIGQLLVLAALADLEALGCRVVVATAGGRRSLQLFRALGFLVLEPPGRTALHPDLILTNVGLVLGSPAHLKARRGCGFGEAAVVRGTLVPVLRYFERREAEVLRDRPLSSFF
jgi:hypothetical protein